VRSFVDTNVWVYAFAADDPVKCYRARRVLVAEADGICTSPQVMGELYVTLTRKVARPMAAADAGNAVDQLARLRVAPIEAAQVREAIAIAARHGLAYWDALIVATARAAGCERVLTEDMTSGFVVAGVRIENPLLAPPHRLAEEPAPYVQTATWDDAGLRAAVGQYEAACRNAGMTRNAVHSYWDYARRFLDWREGLYPRHATRRPTARGPVDAADLRRDALAYEAQLGTTGLGDPTIATYVRHARFFIRWLGGEFQPGARLRGPAPPTTLR
jgi:predicted nucleic acid-binding protein